MGHLALAPIVQILAVLVDEKDSMGHLVRPAEGDAARLVVDHRRAATTGPSAAEVVVVGPVGEGGLGGEVVPFGVWWWWRAERGGVGGELFGDGEAFWVAGGGGAGERVGGVGEEFEEVEDVGGAGAAGVGGDGEFGRLAVQAGDWGGWW